MMMITDARRSKGEPSASSPSEVPVSPAAAAIGLSRSVALSRGGSLLLGVLCAAGSRGHLVPRSRHGLGIAAGPCGISPSAVHGALARAASSSREPSASFREQRPANCPSYTRKTSRLSGDEKRLPWGSVPHRDISRRRPPLRRIPTHGHVPSSAFLTSSTVSSATGLAGLFHPAATSRICPAGVCPSSRSRTGFRRPRHALLSLDASSCGLSRARLCALAFRALLPALSAVSSRFVGPRFDPRPSWASPSPGSLSAHRADALTSTPPTTFTAMDPSRLVRGVSPMRRLACLESGCRPARGSVPEPPSSFRKPGSRPRAPDGPLGRRAGGIASIAHATRWKCDWQGSFVARAASNASNADAPSSGRKMCRNVRGTLAAPLMADADGHLQRNSRIGRAACRERAAARTVAVSAATARDRASCRCQRQHRLQSVDAICRAGAACGAIGVTGRQSPDVQRGGRRRAYWLAATRSGPPRRADSRGAALVGSERGHAGPSARPLRCRTSFGRRARGSARRAGIQSCRLLAGAGSERHFRSAG